MVRHCDRFMIIIMKLARKHSQTAQEQLHNPGQVDPTGTSGEKEFYFPKELMDRPRNASARPWPDPAHPNYCSH